MNLPNIVTVPLVIAIIVGGLTAEVIFAGPPPSDSSSSDSPPVAAAAPVDPHVAKASGCDMAALARDDNDAADAKTAITFSVAINAHNDCATKLEDNNPEKYWQFALAGKYAIAAATYTPDLFDSRSANLKLAVAMSQIALNSPYTAEPARTLASQTIDAANEKLANR